MYRVERKFLVTPADIALIRARLSTVMKLDEHQRGDSYEIRSLYFDDLNNSCAEEIRSGVDNRKKYRLRSYDLSEDLIRLEIKEKLKGFNKKHSCRITTAEYRSLARGESDLAFDGRKQLNELLIRMKVDGMMPKIIVSYERCAFTYPAGNVRITFDTNISATAKTNAMFEKQLPGAISVLPGGVHIMEVKYDEFLPDIIACQLETGKLMQTSFSKYYMGRCAVNGQSFL